MWQTATTRVIGLAMIFLGSDFMNDGSMHMICLGWYKCTETGSTEPQIQWHLLSVKGHYFKYQDKPTSLSALLLLC